MFLPGRETVTFLPEQETDDSYGTSVLSGGGSPVTVTGCHVWPLSSTESNALGQEVNTVYAVANDSLPAGAFTVVEWDGRFWEPLGEPLRSRSSFDGTQVTTVYMKSRGAV